MAKEFLIVDNVCSANKHLLTPLVIGEIVEKIEDKTVNEQYIKIYHNEGKMISTFNKSYLTTYKPKSKEELIYCIKNKGKLVQS